MDWCTGGFSDQHFSAPPNQEGFGNAITNENILDSEQAQNTDDPPMDNETNVFSRDSFTESNGLDLYDSTGNSNSQDLLF